MRQINRFINELEFKYNTKMEGYTILMSYMNELYEIAGIENKVNYGK